MDHTEVARLTNLLAGLREMHALGNDRAEDIARYETELARYTEVTPTTNTKRSDHALANGDAQVMILIAECRSTFRAFCAAGTMDNWKLHLIPREALAAYGIRAIDISGMCTGEEVTPDPDSTSALVDASQDAIAAELIAEFDAEQERETELAQLRFELAEVRDALRESRGHESFAFLDQLRAERDALLSRMDAIETANSRDFGRYS